MGPQRIIHDRRGYLTETAFDPVSGRFIELAVPRPDPVLPPLTPPAAPPAALLRGDPDAITAA